MAIVVVQSRDVPLPQATVTCAADSARALASDAQRAAAHPRGHGARLAVDVQRVVVVEPLRAPVEAHARAARRPPRTRAATAGGAGGSKNTVRLRLRQERAEEARDVARDPSARRASARRGVALHRCADARRLARRRAGPGRRSGPASVDAVAQVIEECCAISVCDAARKPIEYVVHASSADAVVRVRRRQVEHVARREHVVVRGREAAQDLHRQAVAQREVGLPSVAPAAAPEALQQEHVVRVEVRADAAARRGVAHHHVVEARVRDEREPAQQRIGRVVVQVHALHQQRPVARRQRLEIGAAERAVRERRSGGPCARRAATRRRRARRARRDRRARRECPRSPAIAGATSSASRCQ